MSSSDPRFPEAGDFARRVAQVRTTSALTNQVLEGYTTLPDG